MASATLGESIHSPALTTEPDGCQGTSAHTKALAHALNREFPVDKNSLALIIYLSARWKIRTENLGRNSQNLHGVRAPAPHAAIASQKKAGVVEHPRVFDHAGLLCDEPPSVAGLPFV